MMEYFCPVCDPDEDIAHIRKERDDDITYIRWGGCGHFFSLEDATDADIDKQRKEQWKAPKRDTRYF